MKGKTKILLGSALSIAMCASLIAGSTFALFSSEDKVNIAITSGKVDVEAKVSAISAWHSEVALPGDEAYDGTYKYVSDNVSGDSENGFSAMFGTDGAYGSLGYHSETGLELQQFTPGNKVEMTVQIVNHSSITVRYQAQLTDTTPEAERGEHPLIEALVMKIGEEAETAFSGNAIATAWSEPVIAGAPLSDIKLTVELPMTAGDDYQGEKANLTLSVFAVQGNANTNCTSLGKFHTYMNNKCVFCGEEIPFTPNQQLGPNDDPNNYYIKSYTGTEENVYIPSEINGKHVEIKGAFMDGNTTVKSVTFESGITYLSQNTFRRCTNLEEVNLPDTLESLESGTFAGCSSLKSVTVPASVKEVKSEAFIYDVNGYNDCHESNIEEIIFEESGSKLETLSTTSFDGCTKLKKLELPHHSIRYTLGSWSKNYEEFFLRNTELFKNEANWVNDGNGNRMFYLGNHLLAVEAKVIDKSIAMNPSYPSFLTSLKVIEKLTIAEGTLDIAPGFLRSEDLYKTAMIEQPLKIPDTIENISGDTFKLVVNSGATSIYTMVKPVFGADSKLKYIANKAFYDSLAPNAEIIVPKGVEYIGSQAFADNSWNFSFKLASAENLQTIGSDAFNNSTGLQGTEDNYGLYVGTEGNPHLILVKLTDTNQTSFTVNDETKFILAAFYSSNKLTSITLGSKVEDIGEYAFQGCRSLTSLTIPASVKRLAIHLFATVSDTSRKDNLSVTLEGPGTWCYETYDGSLAEVPGDILGSPTEIGNAFVVYSYNEYSNLKSAWVRVTE